MGIWLTFVILHLLAAFQTIHHGHHHVTDDDIGYVYLGQLQTFFSVAGSKNAVFVAKQSADERAHVGIVVYDQCNGIGLVSRDMLFRIQLC